MEHVTERPGDRLMTVAAVVELIGVTRQHLHRLSRAGKFVEPIRLGERRLAFKESEVLAWIESRPRGWQAKPRSLNEARR